MQHEKLVTSSFYSELTTQPTTQLHLTIAFKLLHETYVRDCGSKGNSHASTIRYRTSPRQQPRSNDPESLRTKCLGGRDVGYPKATETLRLLIY
jgi:hypothetical protein